jgi:hypothetical protein
MGSTIRVVDQKFYAKLNNGNDFTINDTTDFARHLKGGITEEIKAVFNVQVEWSSSLLSYDLLYDDVASTLRIVKSGLDFKRDGFSIGDSVKFSINSPYADIEGDVTSLSVGEITLNNVSIIAGTLAIGWSREVSENSADPLTGLTSLTSLKYKFGLIENDEAINFLSKLTNTEQIYLIDNIDHGVPLTFSAGISQGNNKAWVTGSAQCAFVGLVPDGDYNRPQDTTQEFQIEHTFIINPDYRDGEIDSIKGIDTPPEDVFDGDKSLKYVFQTEFRTVLNNPNSSKIKEYDTQLGSVGYYGESYNGFPNGYSVDELVYTVGGDDADQISVGNVTNVAFDLLSTESTFTASTPVIVGHKALINSLAYSNSPNNYNVQWTNESLRTETGDAPLDGVSIKNYEATFVNTGKISIVFDVEFTASQNKILEDGQEYVLRFIVGDPTKTVDTGDKVTGIIDSNVYDKNGDIQGLFDVTVNEQYPIPYEFEKGVSEGFTDGKMFIEDEQMLYARFKVLNTYLGEDLDLTEDVILQSLKFKIVAYNTITNNWFDLRSLDIDLTDQILTGNIQNIELDSNRGYILADVDIFNSLTLTTSDNVGGFQFYDLQVGYKIPWQSWLELIGADTIFLDRDKSQNGLNQNASNYSGVNDYVIKFLIDADLETTGINTRYVNRSGDFLAFDYNTDDISPDGYTCEITTHKEDGTSIEGKIIENQFTEIRAVFTPDVDPVFTESVDMTEVATVWTRIAHGNFYGAFELGRGVDWLNDQANDVDTFFKGDGMGGRTTKIANDLFTSSPAEILTTSNGDAHYGMFSPTKYENYQIEGKIFSTDSDNDAIVYTLAIDVDDFGVESTLSVIITAGGVSDLPNPDFNDPENIFWIAGAPQFRASLIYNIGKSDWRILDTFNTNKVIGGWSDLGELEFECFRSFNDFTFTGIDWLIGGDTFNFTFNFDVSSDPDTEKFIGYKSLGFGFISQTSGGFKDVVLTLPTSDYYGVIRAELKDGSSDFGKNSINTLINNTENSLLKEITGTDIRATLQWDGTSFIVQCLVRTENLIEGESYFISSLLRFKDLIT